jgi:hypothetical protein
MARRRRRTVKTRRRRAPARKRRSTRAGQRRITARRAYRRAPMRRRRARSNPKGVFQTPAARYGMWAAGGAASAVVLDQTPLLKNQIPNPLARSAIMAAIVLFIGRGMKGRIRENSTAYAIGFIIPGITSWVGSQNFGTAFQFGGGNGLLPNGNGNGNGALVGNGNGATGTSAKLLRLSNPGHAYSAANAQVNGGLRAL